MATPQLQWAQAPAEWPQPGAPLRPSTGSSSQAPTSVTPQLPSPTHSKSLHLQPPFVMPAFPRPALKVCWDWAQRPVAPTWIRTLLGVSGTTSAGACVWAPWCNPLPHEWVKVPTQTPPLGPPREQACSGALCVPGVADKAPGLHGRKRGPSGPSASSGLVLRVTLTIPSPLWVLASSELAEADSTSLWLPLPPWLKDVKVL